jgi:hypothetical protein
MKDVNFMCVLIVSTIVAMKLNSELTKICNDNRIYLHSSYLQQSEDKVDKTISSELI